MAARKDLKNHSKRSSICFLIASFRRLLRLVLIFDPALRTGPARFQTQFSGRDEKSSQHKPSLFPFRFSKGQLETPGTRSAERRARLNDLDLQPFLGHFGNVPGASEVVDMELTGIYGILRQPREITEFVSHQLRRQRPSLLFPKE